MRRLFIVFLLINVFLVSNCTEDEILSSNSSLSYLSGDGYEIIDPKKPELHTVNADGNSVTLQFTNHAYPDKPKGGYELMLNDERTREDIIPRLFSDQKNLSLTFSLSNPKKYSYQIYARWNSGYLRSNKLGANESLDGRDTTEPTNTPEDDPDEGHRDVSPAADLKEPVISDLSVNGNEVILKFVNFSSPAGPEGGYELMVDGQRTGENFVPRLFSQEKYLTLKFNISNPEAKYYQVYARWNSGYLRSNKAYPNQNTDNGSDDTPSFDSGYSEVSPAADLKEPVVSDLSVNDNEVTLKFVNFSSPASPEGGYELMVDGQRTGENFVPRLFSQEKYLTLKFNISNPESKYYQVYARWNSGYLRSAKAYPNQNMDDGSDDTPSFDGSVVNFRALKVWNFNGSTPESEGGVKFWGLEDGKIISVSGATDGKAARFYVDTKDRSHNRMELVMTEGMTPIMAQYFANDRGIAHAEMGNELVYQFRVKLSENWQKDTKFYDGDGFTSLFEFKQDYFSSRDPIKRIRDATFRLRISKDTYNFVFRATPESFEDAPRDSNGNIVQKGKAQVKNLSASSDFGKWRIWTVHAKWSSRSDGFIRIFRDNQLVYSRENQYTAYNDEPWLGPYMKFGLYDPWFKFGNDTGSDYKETYVDFVKVGIPE